MSTSRRVTVITGGSQGLGLEIALRLGKIHNHQIVIVSRTEQVGKEAVRMLTDEGVHAEFQKLDITDGMGVKNFQLWLSTTYNKVDVLINNAGINPPNNVDETMSTASLDAIKHCIETNALGSLLMIQALLPMMELANYGRIVNVGTEMASLATMGRDLYAPQPGFRLSKLLLNGITQMIDKEVRGTYNILINTYSPGLMSTENGRSNNQAPYTVEEGAETALWLATLPDHGPSGGFFAERRKFGAPDKTGFVNLPY
eukprot:Nk52_evm15s319 gene=Nk52_evmTU15s319